MNQHCGEEKPKIFEENSNGDDMLEPKLEAPSACG